MVEVRPVEDRDELRRLFDVLGAEVAERIDSRDFRSDDLDTHFPDDRRLMPAAIAEDDPVGGALAFRNDDNSAFLRIIAVVEGFRHRGIGRRRVERVESEARLLGMEPVGLGTDEAVSFWFHLGYTPNLLSSESRGRAEQSERVSPARPPPSGVAGTRAASQLVPPLTAGCRIPRPERSPCDPALRARVAPSALGGSRTASLRRH
jgi:GNAT superfamily N-acetyltransferase